MRRKRVIISILIIIGLPIAAILSCRYIGNLPDAKPLREAERRFGLDDKFHWSFHPIVEDKERVGLHFPGYVIGIEKSPRTKLGIPDDDNVFDTGRISKAQAKYFRKILNDSDRLFLSHLVRYTAGSGPVPRIASRVLYSVYDADESAETPYAAGMAALTALRTDLDRMVKEGRTTHLIIISMGWNTPQLAAIGEINSIVGHLMEEVENHHANVVFRPLVIGVTWPSESSLSKKNYPSKANDADEVGMIWINHLLTDTVLPLKSKHGLKVVMIGHSLGARALTMGIFAARLSDKEQITAHPIDLVVGYEGAFSIQRFVAGAGIEGAPFAPYHDVAGQFVYTWSRHDTATKIGRLYLTPHIGGTAASRVARKHKDVFASVTVVDGRIQGLERSDKKRVLHVDASGLVHFKTYGSGGGAHSDIFRPETAAFLWSLIAEYALDPAEERPER